MHAVLLIQHAMRVRHIVTSFVAMRSPPKVSSLSHKLRYFREKKVFVEYKIRVFLVSTTSIENIYHFKKNLTKYRQKCRNVFMQSGRYSCRILMKLEFSRQVFEKSSNVKFNQNPSRESRVVPCGQTDRRTRRS